MPPLPVLVNPLSGGGFSAQELEKMFRDAGAATDFHVSPDLGAVARALVKERPARVVVAGGDGSVSAVAAALVGTGIPLAVLPTGTLNHFARDIGLPAGLADCVRTAVEGRPKAVDVGEVNGQLFVNNASIGLYPAMVHRREKQQRRLGRGRWHAMLWAMHTVLRTHSFLKLTLELDGVAQRRRTPFVFVGNNEYQMEGFTMGLRARLDGGALSVYMSHRRGRVGLLLLALRALFGRLQQAKDFEAANVSRLRIDSRHTRLLVATDGEVAAFDMPLDFRIRPRALEVVVP